ncbi:hypothetical protein AMTRI_Chr01g128060 [Amborella trichopoda]
MLEICSSVINFLSSEHNRFCQASEDIYISKVRHHVFELKNEALNIFTHPFITHLGLSEDLPSNVKLQTFCWRAFLLHPALISGAFCFWCIKRS